jgi:hypothetical protein
VGTIERVERKQVVGVDEEQRSDVGWMVVGRGSLILDVPGVERKCCSFEREFNFLLLFHLNLVIRCWYFSSCQNHLEGFIS